MAARALTCSGLASAIFKDLANEATLDNRIPETQSDTKTKKNDTGEYQLIQRVFCYVPEVGVSSPTSHANDLLSAPHSPLPRLPHLHLAGHCMLAEN